MLNGNVIKHDDWQKLMALLVLNIVRKENTYGCSEPYAFRHLGLENESNIEFNGSLYCARKSNNYEMDSLAWRIY